MSSTDGPYGPPKNSSKITEKHWPPDKIKYFFHIQYIESEFQRDELKRIILIEDAEEYIKQPKFYGAEWLED